MSDESKSLLPSHILSVVIYCQPLFSFDSLHHVDAPSCSGRPISLSLHKLILMLFALSFLNPPF